MRKPIVAGNWKMNGTLPETEKLINDLLAGNAGSREDVTVVVCPPFTVLKTATELLQGSNIAVGGQDMSRHESGAYTGDISADMLLTVGATYVILGHSERRQYHGESDDLVNAKARRALDADLTPIICVGETDEQREAGQTEKVVRTQVDGCLEEFSADDLNKIVIAYEPVWAIGTGKTATPEQAQEVHKLIREMLKSRNEKVGESVRLLYGGSVKPDNAVGLFEQPDIDGGLIGGASLKADAFVKIIDAA